MAGSAIGRSRGYRAAGRVRTECSPSHRGRSPPRAAASAPSSSAPSRLDQRVEPGGHAPRCSPAASARAPPRRVAAGAVDNPGAAQVAVGSPRSRKSWRGELLHHLGRAVDRRSLAPLPGRPAGRAAPPRRSAGRARGLRGGAHVGDQLQGMPDGADRLGVVAVLAVVIVLHHQSACFPAAQSSAREAALRAERHPDRVLVGGGDEAAAIGPLAAAEQARAGPAVVDGAPARALAVAPTCGGRAPGSSTRSRRPPPASPCLNSTIPGRHPLVTTTTRVGRHAAPPAQVETSAGAARPARAGSP